MKNIFLLVLLVFISCKSTQESTSSKQELGSLKQDYEEGLAISKTAYKPLNKFEGDSLKYLQNNFLLENRDFYIGKPLLVLLNDLELDINHYYSAPGRDLIFFISLSLNFYSRSQKRLNTKNGKDPLVLIVNFEAPLPAENVITLLRKNDGEWTLAEKSYYGQQIVKNVEMVVPNK